jgi:hypothetical protein
MIGIYPVGSFLIMDTKEVGLAVETPENAEAARPIVCLLVRTKKDRLRKGQYVNLSDRDPQTGAFYRNILRCCHPQEFGIQPANFLV